MHNPAITRFVLAQHLNLYYPSIHIIFKRDVRLPTDMAYKVIGQGLSCDSRFAKEYTLIDFYELALKAFEKYWGRRFLKAQSTLHNTAQSGKQLAFGAITSIILDGAGNKTRSRLVQLLDDIEELHNINRVMNRLVSTIQHNNENLKEVFDRNDIGEMLQFEAYMDEDEVDSEIKEIIVLLQEKDAKTNLEKPFDISEESESEATSETNLEKPFDISEKPESEATLVGEEGVATEDVNLVGFDEFAEYSTQDLKGDFVTLALKDADPSVSEITAEKTADGIDGTFMKDGKLHQYTLKGYTFAEERELREYESPSEQVNKFSQAQKYSTLTISQFLEGFLNKSKHALEIAEQTHKAWIESYNVELRGMFVPFDQLTSEQKTAWANAGLAAIGVVLENQKQGTEADGQK